MMADRYFSK